MNNNKALDVGQIWKYKTRPNEENSTLIIVKIDNTDNGNLIHISVRDVKVVNSKIASGYSTFISHLPFSEDYILQSLDEYVGSTSDFLDYEEGYNTWKESFDKKQAGYWTKTVAEVVEIIEEAIKS